MEANYRCTQDELYEGLELLSVSVEEELVALSLFKAKYNMTFVTDFRGKILLAKAIPDEDQRTTAHELKRLALMNLTDGKVQDTLNALKLYMRDAYAPDVFKLLLDEAGYNDYKEAMNFNWDKLKSILYNAHAFAVAHATELEANDNMPANFPNVLEALKNTVSSEVTAMLNLRENTKQVTQSKLVANNELYAIAIGICDDGQHVFRSNEAKRSQFVWNSIMEIVTPPGIASLRGDVKESGTNVPLEGVSVKIQKEGGLILIQDTDATGKFAFGNLEPGVYTGVVMKTGYVSFNIEVTISTGVTSFKHWLLDPL